MAEVGQPNDQPSNQQQTFFKITREIQTNAIRFVMHGPILDHEGTDL